MGLSLGIGKHTFPIWNKEKWAKKWTKDSKVQFLISGLEGLPYFVSDDGIKEMYAKIVETLKSDPWNKREILQDSHRCDRVYVALPVASEYYKRTLREEALKALDEVGIDRNIVDSMPERFEEGLTLINSFRSILAAKLCIIDSTCLPNYEENEEALADYVWRMFSLGVAFGLRKPLVHCFNVNYVSEVASDIRSKCSFVYKDSELRAKLIPALKEVIEYEQTLAHN
jgi:hypothetical protein